MNVEMLKQHLIRDEGYREYVYPDSEGYWTIGIGHLVDSRLGGKLDPDVIDHQFKNDIERVEADLQTFSWWSQVSPIRQVALANMRFQLGPERFRGFRKMIQAIPKAIETGDWDEVGSEAKDSIWYTQTTKRAKRIVQMLLTGLV